MARSTTWRRVLAVPVALLAVPAALLVATTAPSAAATGCRVTYAVSSEWAGGFNGDVTVTNLGDAVDGWTLTWSFAAGQTVSQAWNATVTQSGSAVTAKNAAYNAAIATNGSVNFGFTGAWAGSNPVPSAFALNGTACTGAATGGTTTTTTSRTTTTSTTTRTTTTTTTQPVVTATLYVAGDSTASIYGSSEKPRTGWGQALPAFFTSNITVSDYAKSGRSSKSFIDEGWLDQILAKIRTGDYLIISFGHNDEKTDAARHTDPSTTYKSYLSQYIDKSRAKGAIPILATPVERRNFSSSGVISASHGAYPAAMRELAASRSVPLVDLTASSTALWNSLGVEGTKQCFLWLAAGASPNYPSGVQDNTHFQAHGAIEVARLVAAELSRKGFLPAGDFRRLTTASIPDSSIVWP